MLEAVANIFGCIMLLDCINPIFLCTGLVRNIICKNIKIECLITVVFKSCILANCIDCGEVDIL